ncbi:MAG: glycosyltransferase family 2 protein [Cyanobacteria bacterium J06648_1]
MCDQLENQILETSLDLRNVLVIIPVKDEAETIAAVIENLHSFGLTRIRVVDNGSSDRSSEIAQAAGAEVLVEPQAGYGRACWRGLQGLAPEIAWILFCDGDGSDELSCIPKMLELRQQYDLILGDRRATAQGRAVMTPVQHFGNGLAGWLINWGWGYKYHDLGPLRLINRSKLEQIAMTDRGFGWTVEMQVRATEEDLKICEIPVNYRPRQGGRSKISGTISGSLQAGTIILSTLGKLYLTRQLRNNKNNNSLAPKPHSAQNSSLRSHLLLWLSILGLLIGAVLMTPYGDFRQSSNLIGFSYGAGVMCGGFIVSWWLKSLTPLWFWAVAIATRIILLSMYPGDDIWRYLWEGYIQNIGFSPYDYAPNALELVPYRTPWWSQINHLRVAAIYPPLTQLGFKFLASLTPAVLLFKISFAIADLFICWLLTKKFTYQAASFYAWNPLIIYAFAGGGHYDSWFILPLVVAWVLWERTSTGDNRRESGNFPNILAAALLVGISIAIKWISLPILGFISWITWRKLNLPAAIAISLVGILPICLAASAFCSVDSCSLIPTSSTFVSHGRSAELLPHFLAQVWHPSTKTNSIFALPLGLVVLYLLWQVRNFQQFAIAFFASLLAISPIIHFWYFTWIVPFAVGTKNWGVRLVSISAFVYFFLPYRQALGDRNWQLSDLETYLLWLPFVAGFGWSYWRSLAVSKQKSSN